MPTSAAGNERRPQRRRPSGLTLIELLVVMALLGLVGWGVRQSLPPPAERELARDAQRLLGQLESARLQARHQQRTARLVWHPDGFEVQGLSATGERHRWLSDQVQAAPGPALLLGPEPLLPPQRWALTHAQGGVLWLGSDGLRAFAVLPRGAAP